MNLQYPYRYNVCEGGTWRVWIYGRVNIEALRPVSNNDTTVTIKGQIVHALAFSDPVQGKGKYPRWDCVNGWTTSFDAAKIHNPTGLHGKIDLRDYKKGGGEWELVK